MPTIIRRSVLEADSERVTILQLGLRCPGLHFLASIIILLQNEVSPSFWCQPCSQEIKIRFGLLCLIPILLALNDLTVLAGCGPFL